MIDKEKTESNIRMALSLIQGAKSYLWDEYEAYADAQLWMHEMENILKKTEELLEKHLKGTMK